MSLRINFSYFVSQIWLSWNTGLKTRREAANSTSFMDAEGAEMYYIRSFLLWRDVVWLWVGGGYAGLQLLPLAVHCSTASTRSATVILGLRPHNRLGHREKECAGLMTHRKSDEPHSKPSPAIGQRCAPKARPTVKWSSVQKACGITVCGATQSRLAQGHVPCCSALGCSSSPVTSAEVGEVSVKQDREQKG